MRLLNDTEEHLLIHKNDHFCQARLTVPDPASNLFPIETSLAPPTLTAPLLLPAETLSVDPDGLLYSSQKASFIALLKEF